MLRPDARAQPVRAMNLGGEQQRALGPSFPSFAGGGGSRATLTRTTTQTFVAAGAGAGAPALSQFAALRNLAASLGADQTRQLEAARDATDKAAKAEEACTKAHAELEEAQRKARLGAAGREHPIPAFPLP